jgi:hypothetical protein
MPSVKLTAAELEHALTYIEATRSSDYFPEPFEVKAIRASWEKVSEVLQRVDLLTHTPRQAYEMVAPKQRCLVRPVHLLDPLDLLLYTALTIRMAPSIEAKRRALDERRHQFVYSYRFDATKIGQREMFWSDWDEYTGRAAVLCTTFKFVGTADIVDFFPRVYLHRFENALYEATGDDLAVKATMRMVEAWAHGTSYGIPIGPRASNYLAEALLLEVDEHLLSFDIEFLRWADDYLVFGNTEEEVVTALHRLGTRLHRTEGLSLNAAKTRVREAIEYFNHALAFEEDSDRLLRQKIGDIINTGAYADMLNIDDLTDEQKDALNAVDAEGILNEALESALVDLKAVKFVLRFLSAIRRPELVEPVLNNLARLLPVSDSVARFFDALDQVEDTSHAEIGKRILQFLVSDQYFVPEFQEMWLLAPFTTSGNWNNASELRKLARDATNRFVRRQAILAMRQVGSRSALLDAKSALDDSRDWEQRAILYACSRLPQDEFSAVISQMGGTGGNWTYSDALRKAVLLYGKSVNGA